MKESSVEVVRQGFILSEYDLTDLHIIDWSRGKAYRHPGDAIRIISSWLIGHAAYTIVKSDLREVTGLARSMQDGMRVWDDCSGMTSTGPKQERCILAMNLISVGRWISPRTAG